MSKDRARPFSRKHRRYWLPVTGTMVLIGILNVGLGYCAYEEPSGIRERITYDVPQAVRRGRAVPQPAAPLQAVPCAPELEARIQADLPGSTIVACSPNRVTVRRGDHTIELEVTGGEIVAVAEALALSELPASVMRGFAVAYPRILPARAVKHTRRGAAPTYELAFPDGAPHQAATLRGDGSVVELR